MLTHQGPGHGYHPELFKCVPIMHTDNLEAVKLFGERHGFKVCTGTRYLEGYIVDKKSKLGCLRELLLTWEKNIETIRKM